MKFSVAKNGKVLSTKSYQGWYSATKILTFCRSNNIIPDSVSEKSCEISYLKSGKETVGFVVEFKQTSKFYSKDKYTFKYVDKTRVPVASGYTA